MNSVTNSEPNQVKNSTDDSTEGQNEGHEQNQKKDTEIYKVLFGHQLLPFISILARQPAARSFVRALWQKICCSQCVISCASCLQWRILIKRKSLIVLCHFGWQLHKHYHISMPCLQVQTEGTDSTAPCATPGEFLTLTHN